MLLAASLAVAITDPLRRSVRWPASRSGNQLGPSLVTKDILQLGRFLRRSFDKDSCYYWCQESLEIAKIEAVSAKRGSGG